MKPRVALVLAANILVWSSVYCGIKVALPYFTPGPLALYRILIAAILIGLWGLFKGVRLPARGDLLYLALVGLEGFALYHVALNEGQNLVTPATAAVVLAASPVIITLLACIFLGEPLRVWGWVGIGISFAGVVVVSLSRGQLVISSGCLVCLGAATLFSLHTILQKKLLQKYSALEVTTYTLCFGALGLMVFMPQLCHELPQAGWRGNLAALYLAIFPATVGCITYSYVLERIETVKLVRYGYLQTPVALAIAWVWLSEVPSLATTVGGAITLGGIYVARTFGNPGPAATRQEPPAENAAPGTASAAV